jgi:uncharacterized membrane protein YkgB
MTLQRKIQLLTVSIGLIYFYFGILKLFPNTSPAEVIGISTVSKLCLGLLSPKLCIIALALLEVFIGLSLITAKFLKIGIIVAIGHLVMTFTPFLFFPDLAFNESFAFPSLLGQYIIKNIVLICALLVIYPSEAVLYGKSQLSI